MNIEDMRKGIRQADEALAYHGARIERLEQAVEELKDALEIAKKAKKPKSFDGPELTTKGE